MNVQTWTAWLKAPWQSARRLVTPPAALVLVAVVWGLTYPVTGRLVRHVSPQLLLCLRFGLAFLLLFPGVVRARPSLSVLLTGAALGVVQYLEFSTLAAGLALTPPGRAAFLVSLSVVLIGVAEPLCDRRAPPPATLVAVLVTALGLLLVTVPSGASAGDTRSAAGVWLCLACAACTTAQVVLTGRVMRRPHRNPVPPGVLVGAQLGTVALLSGLAVTWTGGWTVLALPRLGAPVALGLLGGVVLLAVFATVLALLAQTWAQGQVCASRVAVIYALEPVVAVLVGAGLMGERFGALQVMGALCVLCGLVCSEWPGDRRAGTTTGTGTNRD
ncbi:membrane protein [Deinococcus aquiradiocola]|uniref:Membrane protein n=1 Tax=Deinococcus aquiradiocola TaxID=393059 RepID=A0A917PH82_9DEIO|nr:membrane protein [Deinococcus aquiradiocola]